MRRRHGSATARVLSLLAGALALLGGAATGARAAPLIAASLTLEVGPLAPAVFPGVGATGSATSQLGAGLDAGDAFDGFVDFTGPEVYSLFAPITQLRLTLTGNDAGSFGGPAPGQLGGPAAFESIVNFKGIGGITILSVPLKIGVPHSYTQSQFGISLTVIGASWTAGTAVVTGISTGPATLTRMGSNGLNASGVGTLKLVTPVRIVSNITNVLPAFATLSLTYVPEPGTLALLGAGMLALALTGRRRL